MIRRTVNSTNLKLQKSLSKLAPIDAFPDEPQKFVTNLSSTVLSKPQLEALSLGFNFKCPPKNIDKIYVQAQFERFNEQLGDLLPSKEDNRNWLKAKLVDHAHSFLHNPIHQNGMMKQEHYQALKELRNNPNLIVIKLDKGHGVVVMDKNEYIAKMMEILDDKHKFKPDPAPDNVQLIEKQII
ncbi:unnamed protein product, partial [Echinostoma caproni]|uniref:DUF3519 domain-containing protein n=1 Tax=Echinostoma caproni TaxID=27848 RepID=A0A183BFZ0_9TREM